MKKAVTVRIPLLASVRAKSISGRHASVDAPNSVQPSDGTPVSQLCPPQGVKPFTEIPGPKPLPIIGNIWRYIPPFGDFDITKMHKNARKLRHQFGPLVREKVVADRVVVHVFDPQDMETVFRNEGRYPTRLSHRALLKYRQQRPKQYRNGGLFPSNGKDWAEMRTKFQVPMMRQGHMEMYRDQLHEVAEDLISLCSSLKLLDGKNDLTPMLYRWALESTGVIGLDNRLGCLQSSPDGLLSDRPRRLVEAIAVTHNVTMLTENGLPFWRYWDTPTYKKLVKAQDTMAEIVNEFLAEKAPKASTTETSTILQQFLALPGDKRDVYTMIMDLFLAGIDTTAYSMIYLLYHLATHPESQERLRQELLSLQSRLGPRPTTRALEECSYLRACARESHRLLPLALGTGRILESDVTLSGYNVPAGTMMVVHNQVSSRDPSQFPDPDEFRPERWLRSHDTSKGTDRSGDEQSNAGDDKKDAGFCPVTKGRQHHAFSYLPFGYGPRMCIGRRFAEGVINILTFKIITNYSIEYTHDKSMDCFTRLINVPDQPLKLNFKKIES